MVILDVIYDIHLKLFPFSLTVQLCVLLFYAVLNYPNIISKSAVTNFLIINVFN